MKKKLVIVTLLLVSAALAQTNEILTWQQCLDSSWMFNPVLAQGRSAIRELEYGVGSSTANFYPQISASAGFTKRGAEVGEDWKEFDSSSASINLSQDLFSGFGNIATRKRALAQLNIGYEEYRQFHADIEFAVRSSFISALYAQELIELTKKIEERRRNNVRLVQLRFDGGRENAGSLARSKAQLTQAEFEVRQAERLLTFFLRDLAAAIGTEEMPAGVSGTMVAKEPGKLTNLKALVEETTDYVVAKIQVEVSEHGVSITRSGRFPQLDLNASVGLAGVRELDTGSWSVGLRASMQLFTGGRLQKQVAAAKENVVQSEMGLLSKANNLMASLQNQWNAYVDAVENEAVQKQLFEAEQLRAEISSAKYKQGLLSYEDWDIIESNLISQGKTHLQRRRTSEQEQARWKNALGLSVWQTTEKGE